MRIMRFVSRSLLALVVMAAVADGFKLSLPSFAQGWLARFTRSDDEGTLKPNDGTTTPPPPPPPPTRDPGAFPAFAPDAKSGKRSVRLRRQVDRILGRGGRPLPVSMSKILSVRGSENGGQKRTKRAGKPKGAMLPPPDINDGAPSQRNGNNGNGNSPGQGSKPNIFRAKRDVYIPEYEKEKQKAFVLFQLQHSLGLYGNANSNTTTTTTTIAPA